MTNQKVKDGFSINCEKDRPCYREQ